MKHLLCTVLLFISSIGSALTFDSAVPENIKKQMVEDLTFMGQIKSAGQTNLHQQIFGAVDGTKYSEFFTTRVATVGLNNCGSAFAVACVYPAVKNKMFLTQNFIKFSHPQISRMMVVYHEARHTEAANHNWPHDTCPVPFLDETGKDKTSIWTGAKLAGEPACDSTPFGSYGSSTILLKNVAKFCTNCSDKVRMDADLYATDQLGRIDNPQAKKAMLADFGARIRR